MNEVSSAAAPAVRSTINLSPSSDRNDVGRHEQKLDSQQPQSTVSSSSSLALTNSPSSSLTSIPTNSPTSTNFSPNPVSDPISASNSLQMDSCGVAGNLSESDKSAISKLTRVEYEQQQRREAPSVEECRSVPTPASLISRAQENSCDSLSTDDGFVAAASEQQLDVLLVVGGGEEEEEEEGTAEREILKPAAASAISNKDDTDIDITAFDEQQAFASVPIETTRLERSNSCSQADALVHSIEQQQQHLASKTPSVAKCLLGPTSISHEDLSQAAYDQASAFIPPILDSTAVDHLGTQQQTGADCALSNAANNLQPTTIEIPKNEATQHQLLNSQASHYHTAATTTNTGTSRFFSSKLNTGSLWSLLSVGSNHSTTGASNANETMTTTTATDNQANDLSLPGVGGQSGRQHETDIGKSQQQQQQQTQTTQDKNFKSSLSAGFFNKVQQFKRQHSHQEAASPQRSAAPTSSCSIDDTSLCNRPDVSLNEPASNSRPSAKRFRSQVKYIGSAMLHKNFTLPMLEWIARDIKRQTVKGAASTSQRQFTIPAREIILEIQSYQLMGTSCKDGHCIFVHPMHCVSKYAQLQHDPNCFSYLIRDTKESPYFCHVFQAKSTHKVHEIFSAIREATTTQTSLVAAAAAIKPKSSASQVDSRTGASQAGTSLDGADSGLSTIARIQKSASSDGQPRNVLGHSLVKDLRLTGVGSPPTAAAAAALLGTPQSSLMSTSNPIFSSPTVTRDRLEAANQAENAQFENSYQFEVMFVKKVKLQCRRVPATFVDDALETLKSFDVLKGSDSKAQIKGIGKRIISASVDERQEYDEVCQSPTSSGSLRPDNLPSIDSMIAAADAEHRRGSSASMITSQHHSSIKEERESRSCQQSPAKVSTGPSGENHPTISSSSSSDMTQSSLKKHHQSLSCLDNLDSTIKSAKLGETPHYFNDFSPYNTITSNDLNERIAAIPVVSSSVSLDHEMRQKLARQVRETIMATAANIKKDVYASGDKLDTSSSFKVLDSLSCTGVSSVPPIDDNEPPVDISQSVYEQKRLNQMPTRCTTSPSGAQSVVADHRRSSATAAGPFFQPNAQTTNNFDLFRRASARQVVKNRTMLLLIGKDELCTISIDKHQVLFSKSFSSIVHCLQGNNNRDHFGLICRDSGKINPNTESYAGLIFKCQSDKVVREIMGALKQVIYNSQHNYHGYNSIYNPLNAAQQQHNTTCKSQSSPKLERAHSTASPSAYLPGSSAVTNTSTNTSTSTNKSLVDVSPDRADTRSLAAKRGFSNHLELDTSKFVDGGHRQQPTISTAPLSTSTSSVLSRSGAATATVKAPKNLIKSMFCDNCPLYWYHRLCCDIESLPAEASKSIILRRVDSSLAEREQDELYSKFSDFNIESIDEHNEIFMSLLRHICERNQMRHNQTQAHQAAIARNNPNLVKQSLAALPSLVSRQSSLQTPTSAAIASSIMSNSSSLAQAFGRSSAAAAAPTATATGTGTGNGGGGGHQRSGSSGGSLGFVLGPASNQSISDAGTMAIDNLKRAKNNLSVSIENMLKRRSSVKDDADDQQQQQQQQQTETRAGYLPTRSGSFRSATRESRVGAAANQEQGDSHLKRSSSTSDYPSTKQPPPPPPNQSMNNPVASWKDSFSRTINDDLTNPLMGLFRRRSSTFGTKGLDQLDDEDNIHSRRKNGASTEGLNRIDGDHKHYVTPQHQPASPSASSESRFHLGSSQTNGGSSPSSMLSSAFWKKSIFDKIRQPENSTVDGVAVKEFTAAEGGPTGNGEDVAQEPAKPQNHRTREELRSLWKKAILEQITLIKMDKQNQRLQAASSPEPPDIQRIKLNYKDVPYKRDAFTSWERLLEQDPTKKVEFVDVARLVRYGIPKQRRGEIWMFLMNQYQLRHGISFQPIDSEYHGDANQTYRSLLSQLSTQQHEIFVDIGRTFPTHPYYSQYLSIGQLSLFNLLKAYSLLDQEVGYCQGLSFVAGILVLHVDSEDEAFELMRHLLFNFGLRKQYLPSMNALHLQLYQITRLLRDYELEVFNHFDRHDISPSLYAAPWFLTLFASQFPLGFVARLLDLIYLMGIEAIFRVSLNLLAYHRAAILDRKSLESTMDFMRTDLVKIDDKNLAAIFDKSMSIDLRNKLIEYEIEYTFYCAEDKTRSASRYPLAQNTSSGTRNGHETKSSPEEDQTTRATDSQLESTSIVADATATVIIQHLLANNHLKSLQTNYSY